MSGWPYDHDGSMWTLPPEMSEDAVKHVLRRIPPVCLAALVPYEREVRMREFGALAASRAALLDRAQTPAVERQISQIEAEMDRIEMGLDAPRRAREDAKQARLDAILEALKANDPHRAASLIREHEAGR